MNMNGLLFVLAATLPLTVGCYTSFSPPTWTPAVAGPVAVSTTALDRGRDGVLALIGDVGTPTMVRSAPIAVETGTLFFGAFTGAAKILRDDLAGPGRKYIFNVRASYAE